MRPGLIGALVLVVLPGAWITFGLRLPGLPSWTRIATAVVLAPIVVPIQLYVLRLVGVSFERAVVLLVLLNLPALLLVVRRGRWQWPDRHTVGALLALALLCAASLSPQLADVQARAYTGHAWMYADAAYLVANGDLDLEEAELAGVRLAYPWAGAVFQGILSDLVGSPPVVAYIWVNLAWLFCIGCFAAAIVSQLGGGRLSRAAGVVALYFGVNVAGYALLQAMRGAGRSVDIRYLFAQFGDGRFTPWLAKFLFFQQEPFAFGLFIALVFVLAFEWPRGLSGSPAALAGTLLAGLGLVYPILFPAGCAVVIAGAIAALAIRDRKGAIAVGAALFTAGVVAVAHLAFVSRDRVDPMARASGSWWLAAKTVSAAIVLSPLLAGLLMVVRDCWRVRRRATVVLLGGLAGSVVLYVLLALGEWRNEYKFVFTAAICAAPFVGLAFEPLSKRRFGKGTLAIATTVLAIPLAHKFSQGWPLEGLGGPRVVAHGFDLRLAPGERFERLTTEIRERTPPGSILVVGEDPGIHLPTLTRRKLYVPPEQEKPHPGVGERAEDMLTIAKGYEPGIIEERRRIVAALFGDVDDAGRARSLARIRELGRPVVILLDESRHASLARWLATNVGARRPYVDGDGSLWLVVSGSL